VKPNDYYDYYKYLSERLSEENLQRIDQSVMSIQNKRKGIDWENLPVVTTLKVIVFLLLIVFVLL
jgi:hypothetical protein